MARATISLVARDPLESTSRIYEKNSEQKLSKLMEFKNSDLAKQIEEAFPDADLIDIKEDKDE